MKADTQTIDILLLGSGGREHALAAKLAASPRAGKLYIAPGNGGTAVVDGKLVTNGGRVLAVTALGDTFENARDLAYEACEKINFEGKTLRHDIGLRALRGRDAWDA